MKEKIKSKVVWLAVLAQVLLLITRYMPEIAEPFKITATAVIEILTLFGILNNPDQREHF